MDRRRVLLQIFERCAAPEARADLERLRGEARGSPVDADRFLQVYTSLERRSGRAPVELTAAEREQLGPTAIATSGELARVLWLLWGEERTEGGRFAPLFRRAYDDGDNRERIAVLHSLPFLSRPKEQVANAIEATRTHVVPIFEALACENTFPADHFPDLNFNQMALKAAFVELSLARIAGLDRRRTPELARMAADYAAERRAAGRSVPADLHLLG